MNISLMISITSDLTLIDRECKLYYTFGMKTTHAIKWAGTGMELARRLGIEPQAIYQWGEDVPELRQYQIKEMQARERMLDAT